MNCTNINYGEGAVVCLAGCSRVSPGCENCYAARLSATRLKHLPLYKGVAEMRKVGVVGSCYKPEWTGPPTPSFRRGRWTA